MTNKSLFDENHYYTDAACELENAVITKLRGIFDDYVEAGYSPREIEYIINRAASILEMEAVL